MGAEWCSTNRSNWGKPCRNVFHNLQQSNFSVFGIWSNSWKKRKGSRRVNYKISKCESIRPIPNPCAYVFLATRATKFIFYVLDLLYFELYSTIFPQNSKFQPSSKNKKEDQESHRTTLPCIKIESLSSMRKETSKQKRWYRAGLEGRDIRLVVLPHPSPHVGIAG